MHGSTVISEWVSSGTLRVRTIDQRSLVTEILANRLDILAIYEHSIPVSEITDTLWSRDRT